MEKLRLIKVVWLLLENNTEFSDENSELCNGEIIHLWLCREWIWRMHSCCYVNDKIEWVDYTHSCKSRFQTEWSLRLHFLFWVSFQTAMTFIVSNENKLHVSQNQIVIWKTGIVKLYFMLKQIFCPRFVTHIKNTCLQDNLLL